VAAVFLREGHADIAGLAKLAAEFGVEAGPGSGAQRRRVVGQGLVEEGPDLVTHGLRFGRQLDRIEMER